ncbi:Rof/RNase P subunit-like protein [Glarea lozoyensis ATCC 20868]|uniref:Ribonuclease P protein subunit n=1 Tax=Glarea lozoyensis (strain ATCC 20868 / MF5171) TaxID=1116229 RepID=S3D8M5_GLAL2|nr:Rof/RNase P subunit-like protein [Glarea lozoyensis ATCC 20868]EPE28351.1 Rof/RNase P subunit-like protein [Glarea lozoyensis ATCC 20868]
MSTTKQPIAHTLLARAHSPSTAQTLYTTKLQSRPLYLKPSSPPPQTAQQARRLARTSKSKSKRKPKPLTSREKHALQKAHPINPTYALYLPLHKMWQAYMREVLDVPRSLPISSATAAKLCSADYHGAMLEVVRSKCVGRVGLKGIVVREGRGVWDLVTEKDRLVRVPKEGGVVRFVVPIEEGEEVKAGEKGEGGKSEEEERIEEGKEEKKKDLVFELHGDQFIYRAADRANKKFKPRFLPDL